MVGLLTTLKCNNLQVENLDWIITIVKNWPNNVCLNCIINANFKHYIKVEVVFAKENYELIEESKYFEEMKVDNDKVIQLHQFYIFSLFN